MKTERKVSRATFALAGNNTAFTWEHALLCLVKKMETLKLGCGFHSPSSPVLGEFTGFSRPSYSVGLEEKQASNQYQSLVGISWLLSMNKHFTGSSFAVNCRRMPTKEIVASKKI